MLNTVKRVIRSSAMLSALFCLVISGAAANAQTSGSFSIRAVIPDNQIDKRQTYFDLLMQPGGAQTLEVVISNSRDEPLNAHVRLNAASTGRNGLIVYTEPDVRDEIMKVSITDVAALRADMITVPAHGTRSVLIDINMPEEHIEGVLLGGIAVSEVRGDVNAQTAPGVSLENLITYVIALKLTEGGGEQNADFDLKAITPGLVNFKTAVTATLQNKSSRIVKGMEINAQIFEKSSDTALYQLQRDNAEMAPLSNGDFVIDWENRPLRRGDYRLKMTAVYEDRTWEWDESFTIGREADELNGEAVGLAVSYTWIYVFVGLAALALVWLVAYRMGKRRRPDEG